MDVDPKTGWVTGARMEKSTGSKILDDAALWTFQAMALSTGDCSTGALPDHVYAPAGAMNTADDA